MEAAPNATSFAAAPVPVPRRRVVDAPMRMFHWLFALSFVGAYATADGEHFRLLHVTLGYTMVGLLAFRVTYSWFGPKQASLGAQWRKLAGATAWLRSAVQAGPVRQVNWRPAENMLMAAAVVLLMAIVVPVALSGYGAYNEWGDVWGGDWLEELHEFFGEAFLWAVLAHLALIAGLSLWRRKNQALPMLTGCVEGPGPHLVKHNRAWLAALLLMGVVAFGAWEWQQSPNGLIDLQLPGQVVGDEDDD